MADLDGLARQLLGGGIGGAPDGGGGGGGGGPAVATVADETINTGG